MAQRQSTRKIDSRKVQGEGSYVVIRRLTVGEMRAMRKLKDNEEVDAFEEGLNIIKSHIVDWNWCDDNGVPLDLPSVNPDVIDSLTDEEVEFLTVELVGDAAARKN